MIILKRIVVLIFLTFILIGCTNEEEKVISELKSKVEDKYRIVVFDDKMPSDEFQQNINYSLIHTNEFWGKEIYSIGYIVLDENTSLDYDYEEVLSINEYPEIFVFDDQEAVFRTNEIDELEEFILK